ncbi:MAG: NADH-quinone oxidoreductase subunit B family protein [Campylobacterota bacterium]
MFNFAKQRKKSPWVLHYNAGSCNGCDIEILACLNPRFDIERFGMLNKANPKQSDILLITGPVTMRSRERVVQLYSQMPEPKVVVAVGSCACTGGVFNGMYNVEDGIDKYIPVDVYVAGCSATPEYIIDGVVKALEILEKKSKEIEKPRKLFGSLNIVKEYIDRTKMLQPLEKKDTSE